MHTQLLSVFPFEMLHHFINDEKSKIRSIGPNTSTKYVSGQDKSRVIAESLANTNCDN